MISLFTNLANTRRVIKAKDNALVNVLIEETEGITTANLTINPTLKHFYR